jgi:hypothetical protein
LIFSPLLFFLLLGFLIVRGTLFRAKFKKIKLDMSYEQVISIIGLPKSSNTSENGQACLWSVQYFRGWHFTRIVTFKNEKVLSIKKSSLPYYREYS